MKKSKVFGLGMATLLTTGLIAGCGTTGNTSSSGNKQVSLTLGMWVEDTGMKGLVQKQVQAFEKQNPNIKVSIQVIGGSSGGTSYLQALQPMLAAGTGPDVFYVDSSMAAPLESAGALMSLDGYIKKDNINTSAYSSSLLNAFKWQGKTYGLPKDFSTMGLEYNKALLQKAGITNPPSTWTQFEVDAAKLKAKGIAPLSIPIDVARYYPFIKNWGGSYYTPGSNSVTFTNSANQPGLKFFIDNFKKGYFVTPQDQGATWAGVPFANGKVAMALEGPWIVPFLHQTAPKLKYGVSDFPTGNGNNYNMAFTVSYSMSQKTQHPNSAAKLLFFMTGRQAEKMTAESGYAIPSLKSEQSLLLQKFPINQAFVAGVKNAIPYEFGSSGANFTTAINNATQAGVMKNLTPAEVLSQAQQLFKSQQ